MCLQGWDWRDLQCSHQTLTGPWNSRPELPSNCQSCPLKQDMLSLYKKWFLSITFSVKFVSITFYVFMLLLPKSHIAFNFASVTIFIQNRFKCSIVVNHDFELNVFYLNKDIGYSSDVIYYLNSSLIPLLHVTLKNIQYHLISHRREDK